MVGQLFFRSSHHSGHCGRLCSHKNLMACVEQSKALSHKAKLVAFLFKATKIDETTK
jgi:hypothetical protein